MGGGKKQWLHLCQIFEAAAHKWVGAAVGRHLHRVLDQSQQLDRQLVDVQDVAEDHLHILENREREEEKKSHL